MRLARTALVATLACSSLFVVAGPASATCHPERPETCEAEFPPALEECSTSFDPDLPVKLGVCDL
ncbi:MAG TPA: hypothetical protein VNP73_07095 [Actinomycetota bacterium]|nr:hypothetical protein [Actinomycetota bacterium]